MPLPDSESPEQSLGDCAICMDAILFDTSSRRRSKSTDERRDHGIVNAGGGLLNAVQMGVGASGARKNYSLAPCHHLFVSYIWLCTLYVLLTKLCSILSALNGYVRPIYYSRL